VLGVTEAAISQWVRGTTIPRPEYLRMILHYLESVDGVPADLFNQFYSMAEKPAAAVGIRNRRVGGQ